MNKFDTPLLPEWLDGGLQGAVLVAATTLVLACWLTGELLDKTAKLRATEAAEAAERAATAVARVTLPSVLVVASNDEYVRPVTTALASASRIDCAAAGPSTVGGPGVNLHQ